jgi:hypothetical protein
MENILKYLNILKFINIDVEEFYERNRQTSNYIKKNIVNNKYEYLKELDKNIDEYLEFGVDKCEINNFNEFCEKINVDVIENLKRINNNIIHNYYKYTFYSRDKKLVFTCSRCDNYMHYFGITGDKKTILHVLEIFYDMYVDGFISWGNRDFI